MEREEQKFEVRDLRTKEKYFIDDDFLNGYARLIGPNAGAIYNSLSRHADRKQKCWPSIKKLGEEWSMSCPRVIAALKILRLFKIIRIERPGRGANNRYWLLDKKSWLPLTSRSIETLLLEVKKLYFLGKETLLLRLRNFTSHSKDTQKKGYTKVRIDFSEEIEIVYIAYQKKINKLSQLTPKAKNKIVTRLKEYSKADLLKAIDNFSHDSWWMKNNKHRGVAWFFHSQERIEQFINMEPRLTSKRY